MQVVEVDGFLAGAPVDVAEDVEAGLDAPDLAEEVGASEAVVEVVFLLELEGKREKVMRLGSGLGRGLGGMILTWGERGRADWDLPVESG